MNLRCGRGLPHTDRSARTHLPDEMGITLTFSDPEALFQLLVGSSLMSARISADLALSAARQLRRCS